MMEDILIRLAICVGIFSLIGIIRQTKRYFRIRKDLREARKYQLVRQYGRTS